MPTITRILQLAPTACYLSANYIDKRKLFGGSLDPMNPIKIYCTYIVLKHVYDKDPTYDGLQARCNYLYELMKRWALAAAAIVDGNNGGSVAPVTPVQSGIYPFVITSADFEADGKTYINPDIVGDNLMLFINEWTQTWLLAPGAFTYTATGFVINNGAGQQMEGFNASVYDYTVVIQKRNNG